MADYELNNAGQNINYMNSGLGVQGSLGLFLNGGAGTDGKKYPKVDMSLWDQVTMCATCHVGGVFYEQDRQGNRLPARLFADWASYMLSGGTQPPTAINPITTTVWESYDPATGAQTSQPTFAPWVMPMFTGNNPVTGSPIIPTDSAGNPLNLGLSVPQNMAMPNPNYDPTYPGAGPQYFTLTKGQLLMPNVKEMDCLFCHMKGYNNVMASVMTQAGNLAYASTAGAMLMNTMTQSYDMPNAALGTPVPNMGVPVSLSADAVANIMAKPDANNCMQCHATKTLKNLPEMFGTTGTSNGFLSSAPMVYDPAYGNGPLGKRMVSYDINAAMLFPGQTSPVITFSFDAQGNFTGNLYSYMMPGLPFPQAMGKSLYNSINPALGEIGGGNAGHSGPLYYSRTTGETDQNTMKRSTMPFPRAEWFKRGDAWQDGKDVHVSLACAGCHYTGDTVNKNQCDPGRGFDMMSGIQDGVPPLKNRDLVTVDQGEGTPTLQLPGKHDTRNTVKRCEFCHVTGQDYYGNTIETFGAPNPTTAHTNAGLLANVVQIVDKYETSGAFGGQGVPQTTDFATLKADSGIGNHLDVMDCTVCHVQKKSMMVRTLDATSGNRYPSVLGTDPNKGMFSLFEDPATAALNNYAADQYNQMYVAMGYPAPYQTTNADGKLVDQNGVPAVGGSLQPWKPLHTWQKAGNMDLPLSTGDIFAPGIHTDTKAGLKFRRKIYLSNPIVAAIWNNTDPAIDANGDGAPGGILDNSKPSLNGYKDVFTNAALTKNNTQGYGEPIFDPWIMRDLKAGFNFGPAPLSVISVGFGDPLTAPYGTAYNQQGLFTGEYQYVSVWSGAVVLTEPDQIAAYKASRGNTWNGTELALVGDPFTVTHGIASATTAQGKPTRDTHGNITAYGCNQCHAPGAGFFNGDFTMTGTAIPASATFDPTAMLATTGTMMGQQFVPAYVYDANAYLPMLDQYGDPIRMQGLGMASASDMMSRPLEPYRVKALKGDLRTSFEGFNKLGQPRTAEFQEDTACSATDARICTHSVPLQRADALYPPEKKADGSDLKIYCKASDDCAADPSKLMNGQEYAAYLETGVNLNVASYGFGVNPVAKITTPIADADPTQTGIQVATGTALPIQAEFAQPNAGKTADIGTVTYAWTTSDPAAVIANPTSRTAATFTFSTTGTKIITLTVTDEEGKVSSTNVTVYAVVPPIAIAWVDNAGNLGGTINVSNLLNTTKYVKIYFGDGSYITQTITVGATTTSTTRTYATAGSKLIQVYAYNSLQKQISYMQQSITVNGAN